MPTSLTSRDARRAGDRADNNIAAGRAHDTWSRTVRSRRGAAIAAGVLGSWDARLAGGAWVHLGNGAGAFAAPVGYAGGNG